MPDLINAAIAIVTTVERHRQAKLAIAEQFAQRQRAAGEPTLTEMCIALSQPADRANGTEEN